MSGPKSARYILTPEQRRCLEEQHRAIRQEKAALERRAALYRTCIESLSGLREIIADVEKACSDTGNGGEEAASLNETPPHDVRRQIGRHNEIACGDGGSLKVTPPHCVRRQVGRHNEIACGDSGSLWAVYSQIEERIKKIAEKGSESSTVDGASESFEEVCRDNGLLNGILQQIRELQRESQRQIIRLNQEYQETLTSLTADAMELSFSGLGSGREFRDNKYIIKIKEALGSVEMIELTEELKQRFSVMKERAEEIRSLDFLENFYSMQVCPFVRECEYFRDHIEEYENLKLQYQILAGELMEPVRDYPFSKENLKTLEAEVQRLEQLSFHGQEQEYIKAAVDEAMVEMGYELVGNRSVVKKSGKSFRNNLYVLEEGTAVNVTFSENGLDDTDRMPEAEEAEELAEDMRAFCTDYAALEKKLAKKGVAISPITMLPPSPEYASVINTSDYELKRSVQHFSNKREKKKADKNRRQQYL